MWEWLISVFAVRFISFKFSYTSILCLSNILIIVLFLVLWLSVRNLLFLSAFFSRGYTAPEYAIRGELSEKADIYSFGVLVLEIIGCRKNTDLTLSSEMQYLPEYVSHQSLGKIYLFICILLVYVHSLC